MYKCLENYLYIYYFEEANSMKIDYKSISRNFNRVITLLEY